MAVELQVWSLFKISLYSSYYHQIAYPRLSITSTEGKHSKGYIRMGPKCCVHQRANNCLVEFNSPIVKGAFLWACSSNLISSNLICGSSGV